MIRILCILPLVAGFILLFIAPANADVSYEGYYFALAFILVVLFLPVFIVALLPRTRKKLYLATSILWAVAAFAYLWFSGGRQNEFILISSVSYLILVIYILKEKKLA
jgi:hypothetical protein